MNKTVATTAKEAIEVFPEVSYWYNEYLKHNTVSAEENQPEPEPVHAIDISQERVDETTKHGHEPVPNDYDRSIHSNPDAQAWAKFFMATVNEQEWCIDDIDESLMTGWFANAMMAMHDHVKREWVGLTDEERMEIRTHSIRNMGENFQETLCKAIEAKLKEKNR
jgi:hypothetical protein